MNDTPRSHDDTVPRSRDDQEHPPNATTSWFTPPVRPRGLPSRPDVKVWPPGVPTYVEERNRETQPFPAIAGSRPFSAIAAARPAPPGPPDEPAPGVPAETREGRGRRRRKALPASLRVAMLAVAAIVAVGGTIGVEVWDRSFWVADRYPDEIVHNVGKGKTADLQGMRWGVTISRVPPSASDKPGRVMLKILTRVTPIEAKSIKDFGPPRYEMRDDTGRTWQVLSALDTPIRDDMRVGKTEQFTEYGVVPAELADTARVALSFYTDGSDETLLFSR